MERLVHLSEAKWLALDKFTAVIGVDQIDQILVQDSEVLNVRLEVFMRYKTTLIRQVRDHVALVMPTHYIQVFKE